MSSSRQRVSLMLSDARNASADENARAQKPNCRIRSGSDSRTDSSSSTTDTSERSDVMTASSLSDGVRTAGNRNREGGPRSVIRFCPEAAAMPLHDGAANGEPDTHAVALRCVEGIEQLVHALPVQARAGIPHHHAHAIAVFPFRSDQHLPQAIVHTEHRVRGVAEQVDDDLLELDTIAGDGRQIVGEFRLDDDLVSVKFSGPQRYNLS